ncbi:hypothetical protein AP071_09435 [Rhodobacter capsulatus]|nr:hypothetical protein AP073_08230 [Rhodobacter capsulatus]KQB11717.1 hypothetical protein AP071_09435 [Rhodobacter capsulatus]
MAFRTVDGFVTGPGILSSRFVILLAHSAAKRRFAPFDDRFAARAQSCRRRFALSDVLLLC